MFGEKWLLLSQMLRDVNKDLGLWGKERGAHHPSFFIILGCLVFFVVVSSLPHGRRMAAAGPNVMSHTIAFKFRRRE